MPRSSHTPTPAPPGHVWSEEASRLTGLSVKTLYNYRHKHMGPISFPIGRKLAFPLDGPGGINAWLDAQRSSTVPDAHESRPPEPRQLRPTSRSPRLPAAA